MTQPIFFKNIEPVHELFCFAPDFNFRNINENADFAKVSYNYAYDFENCRNGPGNDNSGEIFSFKNVGSETVQKHLNK
jgi:hypothetical protein